MSKSKLKLATFVDHVGRTIIAEHVEDGKDLLKVKNPAIIHVQPMQNGQLNVQTIPLYFREFVSEENRKNGTTWSFNKANIVVGNDVVNDARLVDQYVKLFSNDPVPAGAAQIAPENKDKVIKLFDS